MPVQIPTTIRNVLGDKAALDFIPLVEQIVVEKAIPRDEYREVLSRLDILEHDVADIKVEQREQRREMGEFRQEVNERFDRVNERFDQMNERLLVQTRWMVGTLALFGTLITVLLAFSQFTP